MRNAAPCGEQRRPEHDRQGREKDPIQLASLRCVACRRHSPQVTAAEVTELKQQVPEWNWVERDDCPRLERVFSFSNFAEALAFTMQVGALAEAEDHHPALLTEWGNVTVTWWTYIIGGLHRNDFIMAAKTDALYNSGSVHFPRRVGR